MTRPGDDPDVRLRYLSLGAGVQSSTLALMIAAGEIKPVDCAIFADTGWESAATYRHLDWLTSVLPYPVHRVSAGSLRQHVLGAVKRSEVAPDGEGVYRGIPAYVRPGGDGKPLGMLRRQCTREYKLAPITAEVRRLLGVEPGRHVPRGVIVEQLTGISADEADRAKPAEQAWLRRMYPLLDLRMSRMACVKWLRDHGYHEPSRSSCLGCPLHTRGEWRTIRQDPVSWADVVEVDEAIRGGLVGGITAREVYLHASGRPLVEAVDDTSRQTDIFGTPERGGWGNECEGICGV